MLSAQDIAWAAGVYEGEGSAAPITATRRGTYVQVTQKDPWLVHRLQSLFGGSIYQNKSFYWRWSATGPTGRGFLMTIYKFLSPRRKAQVRAAITPPSAGYSAGQYAEMQKRRKRQ